MAYTYMDTLFAVCFLRSADIKCEDNRHDEWTNKIKILIALILIVLYVVIVV